MTKPTKLDANQVIKNVYNEEISALDTVGVYDEIQSTFLESIEENLKKQTDQINWDQLITTFPAPNVDFYTYKLNDTVVRTVKVIYENNAKKTILLIEKTSF
jgi:squalene cyclase